MFLGRNYNGQEIPFEIFLDAFRECFFCKYYTSLKNDLLFNINLDYLKNLELFRYQPKIYPNYLDQAQALIFIIEFIDLVQFNYYTKVFYFYYLKSFNCHL